MKKRKEKTLVINKLRISKMDFSEKIKGGSDGMHCPENSIAPACPSGIGCVEGDMGW